MKKQALFTSGGLAGTGGGVYSFYLFLNSLNDGANFLFFGLSILLIGGATYAFLTANKAPKPKEDEIVVNPLLSDADADRLKKNNEMAEQFGKTLKAKEQLRLLELADQARNEA